MIPIKIKENIDILVCIKQVPGTNKVEVEEKTGVLKRDGVRSKMNPYDLYAIELALRIKEQMGAEITVITMGPPQAEDVIREAYMLGVDKGILLSDRKFAGADVLATSYTLAMGIKKLSNFDLIICGKQTTDGDTGQVGPSLAEHLGIPHITWVKELREITEKGIIIEQDMGDCLAVASMSYPCLITVEKDIVQPRLPSYREKLKAKDRAIELMGFDDMEDQDEKKYGLTGSATQVERIFSPSKKEGCVLFEGDAASTIDNIYNTMLERKII